MPGRNDPCPCGSGKKYKKCCLAKERAGAVAAHQVNVEEDEELRETETAVVPQSALANPSPNLEQQYNLEEEVDPLVEQYNVFWEAFDKATYAEQWTIVENMLADEPDLIDSEIVFETANTLFPRAVEAEDLARFSQLLDQFETTTPEAYQAELGYILQWRIGIALIDNNKEDIARYFYQFSPVAGDKLDTYYQVISALSYHGQLEILHQGMIEARPAVVVGDDLVPWAADEFDERLGTVEELYLLEQNPNLMADDPTLLQRFAEYELTVEPQALKQSLDFRTGRMVPTWQEADLELTPGMEKDPAARNLSFLLSAFTYYAVSSGISPTKAEMARNEIFRYFVRRSEGELSDQESYGRRRPKGKRGSKKRRSQKRSPQHPLCPDPKTLDRYLAGLIGFMAQQHYEASAFFELIPVWLKFLQKYDLLDENTRNKTLQELAHFKGHLLQFTKASMTDPLVWLNLADWPD